MPPGSGDLTGPIGRVLEKTSFRPKCHMFLALFSQSDQNERNPIADVLLPDKLPNMTLKEINLISNQNGYSQKKKKLLK